MAALPNQDRVDLWKAFMQNESAEHNTLSLIKTELRAAVDAADAWADANAASFNSAIPLPARSALTTQQKALLLMFVIRRRWEVS
jgi:hypothetical protein